MHLFIKKKRVKEKIYREKKSINKGKKILRKITEYVLFVQKICVIDAHKCTCYIN